MVSGEEITLHFKVNVRNDRCLSSRLISLRKALRESPLEGRVN
jgi:hypothetical protein